jgi:glycogen debranching enzyme
MLQPQTKTHRLSDPIAACGDRLYIICSQNGLFPDTWGGHVPREMWGVWAHPIKLLDGFWFGLSAGADDAPQWLLEARACRAGVGGYTEFDYEMGPLSVTRRDMALDGLAGAVITLTLHMREHQPGLITLHALFRSDLRPAWLGEEQGWTDGPDTVHAHEDVCLFHDTNQPWACAVSATRAPDAISSGNDLWAAQQTSGQGISAFMRYTLETDDKGVATISFFIAGSENNKGEMNALATLQRLRADWADLAAAKMEHYRTIATTSQVTTPDAALNEAMGWSKLIAHMLLRRTPTEGGGVGAGLPEYPWWFGIDTEYAVLPMLQSGQFELVRETLLSLQRWSQQYNPTEPGRVLHELSTTGVAFNKGNMVETLAFTRAVHQYWLWTGEHDFLEQMYVFCKQGVLDYALGQNDADGDLCPAGRSIIETLEMHAGFEVIDVAAYTWEALLRLADMAAALGDDSTRVDALDKAARLASHIRTHWWLDDAGLFADVRASVDQVEGVLTHLEQTAREQSWLLDALSQVLTAQRLFAPLLAQYHDQPRTIDLPWLLRHWVVFCPVEVGLATPEQAQRVLQRMYSAEFGNAWGMYLHPERHDVMSINTGLLALATARYGQVDAALDTVHKLVRAFSYRTPGAVSEALPDQWCFLQLWSNVGLVSPVVECFLGIEPRAAERRLRIAPNLPSTWAGAEVRRLRMGDTFMDVRFSRDQQGVRVEVGGASGWTLELGAVLPPGATLRDVRLNGQPVTWRTEQTHAGTCALCVCDAHAGAGHDSHTIVCTVEFEA